MRISAYLIVTHVLAFSTGCIMVYHSVRRFVRLLEVAGADNTD
jgi:hypothetical protein